MVDYNVSLPADIANEPVTQSCIQFCQQEFNRIFEYAQYEFISLIIFASLALFMSIVFHYLVKFRHYVEISDNGVNLVQKGEFLLTEFALILIIAFLYLTLIGLK